MHFCQCTAPSAQSGVHGVKLALQDASHNEDLGTFDSYLVSN